MGGAGVLTSVFGARWVWLMAGGVYVVAAAVALFMTRWLPVDVDEQERAVEAAAAEAASVLDIGANGKEPEPAPEPGPEPVLVPEAAPLPEPGPIPAPAAPVGLETVADGASTNGLERIATLLEQIEERRQLEERRTK